MTVELIPLRVRGISSLTDSLYIYPKLKKLYFYLITPYFGHKLSQNEMVLKNHK